jgi:protein-tyrosine phosphatase
MIDFHNHILPGIDDGSKSTDISLEMLTIAQAQGITEVVNTVHFQHPKMNNKEISYKIIKEETRLLQDLLNQNKINIKLHFGSEVYFLPNLIEIKNNPLTTFGYGKYMLIEFPLIQVPEVQKKHLFELKLSGVTPIIAHPERYITVQDNLSMITTWLEAGCLIQVDAGSILGKLGKKSKVVAEKILKNGWCQIIGSDSHDNLNRNFCLEEARDCVTQWVGLDCEKMFNENPKRVLEGKSIEVDFEYYNEEKNFFKKLIKRWA